ncbi:hypothetical protein CNYM01_11880 [Colletotrichum nymphaeae SA-01]|uniref:DUF6594 domain-containing protein n=1 Tax=Colletotrichum nymphaeae SA-01 TaxID=1460502 RepID=A0A135TJI6_9PEZI|nr:hypothetical protein CNYM01_11880 [Colletotrichum nymphaeae SA-01]
MSSTQNSQGGTDQDEETVTKQDIAAQPWKYIGYKGYSRLVASEDDFFLLRKFGVLNARVALVLQDEIVCLEESLDKLDNEYSKKTAAKFNNSTIRRDVPDRSEILKAICDKLPKYNEFLIQQTALRGYPQALRHNVENLKTWHKNKSGFAIAEAERKYLEHESDLVAVHQRERTPLRQVIDSSLQMRTLSCWKIENPDVPLYDEGQVSYYSDKRIDRFASAIIIAIGVLMLITPIWILQAVNHSTSKLAVITVFIFVFLLILSLAMVAKPFEALGATAAYAAVLMVFLQLQSEGS